MKMLVTGGAGFIGSHYVRNVLGDCWGLDAPESVVVLDKLTYAGTTTNLTEVLDDPRLRFVEGDILDRGAGRRPDGRGRRGRALRRRVARRPLDHGRRRLRDDQRRRHPDPAGLRAAARHRASSCTCRPTRSTGRSTKARGTRSSRSSPTRRTPPRRRPATCSPGRTARTHELPVCVTRCSNNYGPHQFPEKVIPLFVTNLLDGGTVPLYGEGANVRDWLHVDDHCRGIHLVLGGGRPGEVYNIGGGTELPNKELTARLLAACGKRLGERRVRRGPQGPRPALLGRHQQDLRASSATSRPSTSSRASPPP